MAFQLNVRSLKSLQGVHPALQAVVYRAADLAPAGLEFIVTEGLRSPERQSELVAAGASWTLNSRHITGHAVDLAACVAGEVRWDWPLYYKLADLMKAAAADLKTPLEWGGDWKTRKDGPHFQLPRGSHP